MNALGPYSTLFVPAVIAVGLIWLAIRIAKAIMRLVVVALVILLAVWSYTQYQHVAALQSAAQRLATQPGSAGAYGATASAVLAQANGVLAQAGLDPSAIQATVTCAGGTATLVLRDTQASGALGLLGGSTIQVHLSPAIHCGSTP